MATKKKGPDPTLRRLVPLLAILAMAWLLVTLLRSSKSTPSSTRASRVPESDVTACVNAIDAASDAVAVAWISAAERGLQPTNMHTGDAMIHACSKLYTKDACRQASEGITEKKALGPAAKMRRLVETCRDAYCPELAVRPPLCSADFSQLGASSVPMWEELDEAILAHELGSAAPRVIEARRRAKQKTGAALERYVDAGSPSYRLVPTATPNAPPPDAAGH